MHSCRGYTAFWRRQSPDAQLSQLQLGLALLGTPHELRMAEGFSEPSLDSCLPEQFSHCPSRGASEEGLGRFGVQYGVPRVG